MSALRIYLVRHGESLANAEGLYQGRGDSPLSDLGKQQAKVVATKLEHLESVDVFIASSAVRTLQTSEIIGDHLSIDFVATDSLLEIDVGELEGTKRVNAPAEFPDFFTQRSLNKSEAKYPGGESYQELISRIEGAVDKLPTTGVILVVAHEVVNRALLTKFTDLSLPEALAERQAHDEIFCIEERKLTRISATRSPGPLGK